jgi:hypothetical protein
MHDDREESRSGVIFGLNSQQFCPTQSPTLSFVNINSKTAEYVTDCTLSGLQKAKACTCM